MKMNPTSAQQQGLRELAMSENTLNNKRLQVCYQEAQECVSLINGKLFEEYKGVPLCVDLPSQFSRKPQVIQAILDAYEFQNWHIEYHDSHGACVVLSMGASAREACKVEAPRT